MLTREMLAPHTALLLRHDLFEGIQADDLTALVNALDGELKHYAAGQNIMRMGRAPIVTGIILGRLIADNVYFVNVSTWRKYWKFSYKDRSKKSMKLQAVAKVSDEFDLNVKDDEADAILIGSYFVNHGQEFGNLENHKVS